MEKIRSFTGLVAWQEAHKFVLSVYAMTKKFPPNERFGLTSQLRRASVSISSNIAEGFRRKSRKEKQHFYEMALSSLTETHNQLLLSKDIDYITNTEFQDIAQRTITIGKLLTGLSRSSMNYPG